MEQKVICPTCGQLRPCGTSVTAKPLNPNAAGAAPAVFVWFTPLVNAAAGCPPLVIGYYDSHN